MRYPRIGLGIGLFGLGLMMSLAALPAHGMGFKKKKPQATEDGLQQYVEKVKSVKSLAATTGSFWTRRAPIPIWQAITRLTTSMT